MEQKLYVLTWFKINLLLIMICVIGGLYPAMVHGYRYVDKEAGHDAVFVGVGVYRQNFTSVNGDDIGFEESDDGLPPEWSNRSRFSLYGEGTVSHDYTFELSAQYDEEDDTGLNPTYFLKVNRDRHYLILGDHRDGQFEDTVFTMLDRRIRGATVHGEVDTGSATLMAGVLQGETIREEIPGDGTSGPYRLENTPVIDGSEIVEIQVRDRTNPDRIIRTEMQTRGQDYTIDYDDGEINFRSRVEEQDFRGNPVVIVVVYQYESVDGMFNRSTWGGRVTLTPTRGVMAGATFLADGPWDPGVSDIWDQRRQIYGTDLTLELTPRYRVGLELARSEVPDAAEPERANGFKAGLDANPIDPLRVYGRYWRVERDFLSFGNANLAAGSYFEEIATGEPFEFTTASLNFDLDPNISDNLGTDEESAGISATYDITEHDALSAGFRQSHTNLPEDETMPTDNTRKFFTSYKRIHPEKTDVLVGAESIRDWDDSTPRTRDTQTYRLLGAVKHPLGTYRYLGDLHLMGAYQYEDFDDTVDPENSERIHDMVARLEMLPWDQGRIYLEQAEQLVYSVNPDQLAFRTDISAAGFSGRVSENSDMELSAKYRVLHNEAENVTEEVEQIYTALFTTKPWKFLRAGFKAEYRDIEYPYVVPVGREERMIFGGSLLWHVMPNLTARIKYEREIDRVSNGETSTYDDMLFRLNYKFRDKLSLIGYYRLEEDHTEEEPLAPVKTRLTTWLLGAKYQITKRVDLATAWKEKILESTTDENDHRKKFYIETGYQLNRYLKVSVGYEHFEYDRDNGDQEDYNADVGYFSLIFKL